MTALRALVICQLIAVVVIGALTVSHFFVWAGPGDERAHYSYVQILAQEQRLPVLNQDHVSRQVQAITDDFYPRPSPRSRFDQGIRGKSYEAFQPPLYYLLAVPVFDLSSDYMTKLYLMRSFDLVLYLIGIAACAALARVAFGRHWLVAFSIALTLFLWPGVLARGITVSNAALETPLALWFLFAVWRAWTRDSPGALLAAGTLLGMSLVTQVTLVYLVPVFGLVLARQLWRVRTRRTVVHAAGAVLIASLMLAPWVAFNESHYHSTTANQLAQRMQKQIVNPSAHRYTLSALPGDELAVLRPLLPEEWSSQNGRTIVRVISDTAIALVFAAGIAGMLLAGRSRRRSLLLLGLPAIAWLVTMNVTTLIAQWNLLLPRYGYPVMPALALSAALAVRRLPGGRRVAVGLSAVMTAMLVGLWADLASRYYL